MLSPKKNPPRDFFFLILKARKFYTLFALPPVIDQDHLASRPVGGIFGRQPVGIEMTCNRRLVACDWFDSVDKQVWGWMGSFLI